MTLFLKQHKHFLLLVCCFIVAEIIVNPLGEFPLNDDWCYAQTVIIFNNTGKIFLGNWPAMTLCTQVFWGYAFTKLFGFSLVALRFSTMLSTLIGFAVLNKLIIQITKNRTLGFLACLLLMFVPLVFNLTNTFMTDVTFNTLAIIACYFMYNFFKTQGAWHYLFFIVFSIALVLLRQYGTIFPACFIIASFFVKEKKLKTISLAVLSLALTITVLKLYESYLKETLPPGAAYKFSGNTHIFSKEFWNMALANFQDRHKEFFRYMFVFAMPFALVFFMPVMRQAKGLLILIVFVLDALFTFYLFHNYGYHSDSTVDNMMVGNEAFYSTYTHVFRHNWYQSYDTFMLYIKIISVGLTFFVTVLGFLSVFATRSIASALKPELIFFLLLVFAYSFMITITESYFDRYHIPLITLAVILTAYLGKFYTFDLRLAAVPVLFWACISILGTKDYLEMNRQKLKAYLYLRNDLHVPKKQINPGVELKCYNEGEGWGWQDFLNLDVTYLIQFTPEKDFKEFKAYEFQRYFPYKKDKIYIFVRHDDKTSKHDQ